MRHLPFAVALSLLALPAQETPQTAPAEGAFQAKHFLPDDYKNIAHVNLQALRDTGVWDELAVGLLKALLGQMEEEAGFPLAALDRVTLVSEPAAPKEEGMAPVSKQVSIFEGNRDLGVPNRVARNATYDDESIGIYDVKRRSRWDDELFFRPRPEVQIYGATAILRPMLEGKPSNGVPCADIMSLMTGGGGGGGELCYFVVHAANPMVNKQLSKTLFSGVAWPEGDGLQFMMLRLRAKGDADDPNLVVDVVLRHRTDGEGLNVTERAVQGLLDGAAKEPQLRLIAPLLKDVVRQRDRTDLSLQLDLGTGRTAANSLTMLLLPLLAVGTTVEGSVEPVPAAGAPAAPLAPPKPDKKK